MWETAGGWGLVVAGEPPQSESLPEEETPPHPTKLQCLRPAGQYARGRQRGQSRGELLSDAGVCGPLVTPCGALPCDLVHRLECLQRIVSKLQMEAGLCEEQLNQADALLQSVREREEAGRGGGVAGQGVG